MTVLRNVTPLRAPLALLSAPLFACGVEAQPPLEDPLPATHTEVVPALEHASTAFRSCAPHTGHDVTLSRDVEPILTSSCSGEYCHGLSMTSPARTYAFLVNQYSLECDDARPLVAPGDPEHSYLVDKIRGTHLCAGHPMPRGIGNRLSPDQIRTVTDWICEGALDD